MLMIFFYSSLSDLRISLFVAIHYVAYSELLRHEHQISWLTSTSWLDSVVSYRCMPLAERDSDQSRPSNTSQLRWWGLVSNKFEPKDEVKVKKKKEECWSYDCQSIARPRTSRYAAILCKFCDRTSPGGSLAGGSQRVRSIGLGPCPRSTRKTHSRQNKRESCNMWQRTLPIGFDYPHVGQPFFSEWVVRSQSWLLLFSCPSRWPGPIRLLYI
jgi:hypothetical protein